MKVYISEENFNEKGKLGRFELVGNYNEANNIVIVPGGLSSIVDMAQGIVDGKDVYVYNKDLFYAPVIEQIYRISHKGMDDKPLFELFTIERDLDNLIEKMEEKNNGKINNGQTR